MDRQNGICSECNKEVHRGRLNGYGICSACWEVIESKKNFTQDFQLFPNDRIVIHAATGDVIGRVLTAAFYGKRSGWYIELTRERDNGYGYWKQGCDGGRVEKLGGN